MAALLDHAVRVARAALRQERIRLGPWKGSMRSISAEMVPPDYMAESDSDTPSSNFLYVPRHGRWKRRKGTTQVFDTFGSAVGMLPAKWGGKCRQLEEFSGTMISNGIPTVGALLTKETNASASVVDDGPFSTFWIRDQLNSMNYTIGSEFSTDTYPAPGTEQAYKYLPLWYKSGDGGATRGISEFQRRLFLPWSRRFLKVGRWHYFPSFKGTPSRWLPAIEPTTGTAIQANGHDATNWNSQSGSWGAVGNGHWTVSDLQTTFSGGQEQDVYRYLLTDESNFTNFAYVNNASGGGWIGILNFASISSSYTAWRITIRYYLTEAYAGSNTLRISFNDSAGNTWTASDVTISSLTVAAWTTLTLDVTSPLGTGTANRLTLNMIGSTFSPGFYVGYLKLEPLVGGSSSRLIPSGPLPPTHAGTLAKGDQIESNTLFERPDADITDSTWLNSAAVPDAVNLYSYIDETDVGSASSDADYISSLSDTDGGGVCEIGLSNFGVTPAADDTVQLTYRFRQTVNTNGLLGVDVYQGATLKVSTSVPVPGTFSTATYTFTPSQITSITDWTDLRIKMGFFSATTTSRVRVTYVALSHVSASGPATEGGWRGSDKFYYSVAYRWEDDSIWMPCVPRGPNDTLTEGFNLFQVDPGNAQAGYEKVTWSNIPIGVFGTKSRILLRTPKIDASTDSILALNPTDLRVVWEIKDNTTTTYDDFYADDDALGLDVDRLLIRDDHIMPPRARYVFGGDSRVCHSYGGLNPCAIILAPIGRLADYDLNADDETATLWGTSTGDSSYYRINNASGVNSSLELINDNGGSLTTETISISATTTLESIVDTINATSFSVDGQQWRAQMAPGANPQALAATHLTPTSRAITSCVVSGQTITKTGGELANVAVGNFISGTGVTAGAYVSSIDSTTQLTFVGTITSGTKTLTFTPGTGDTPTGLTQYSGCVRVISNSLPGFLFFNSTYLDMFPVEKSAVWMTVASPGSIKSAPNCFSGKISNKHTPPLEAGISMGGFAVDNGFVVPFSQKNAAIRNTRDTGTGIDSDYKLFILNEARGCCAWQSIAPAARFGFFFSPEGWIACDLYREIDTISNAIYLHGKSDSVAPTGDYSYEAPLCIAATGKDVDHDVTTTSIRAGLVGRVIRGVLWTNWRFSSASSTHPNRQTVYDFSEGGAAEGLAAAVRANGEPWGWSVPLVRSVTAMTEGRRGDGAHLYGWNEENGGSTGDGRIDEIETSDTDNGTAISGALTTPWIRVGSNKLSAQEITLEHTSASLVVSRDVKMLTLPSRAATAACFVGFRQTGNTTVFLDFHRSFSDETYTLTPTAPNGPSELRSIELRLKSLPSYT